jgi:DNA-binding MarR family transcriptional regulator
VGVDARDEAVVARLRLTMMQLSRLMRQESGNETTLTPSRFSALSTIDANNPLRMTDLAITERVSKSSITRIVGKLADAGLVQVLPDPTDGRSTLVGVTPKGKEILATSSERTDAFLAQQLTTFSEAERLMLEVAAVLLERLTREPVTQLRRVVPDAQH